MIALGPFTEEQYAAWIPGSIADYAAENVKSGRWSAGEARAKAQEELTSLLPQGMATPGHHFFSVVRSSDRAAVGMIWVLTGRAPGRSFIFNLEIFKPYRRKGYAEQAMRSLEHEVRRMGDSSIGLHVFAHNAPARSLYQKLGYAETNIMMVKRL